MDKNYQQKKQNAERVLLAIYKKHSKRINESREKDGSKNGAVSFFIKRKKKTIRRQKMNLIDLYANNIKDSN